MALTQIDRDSQIKATTNTNSVAYNNGSGVLTDGSTLTWDGTTLDIGLFIAANSSTGALSAKSLTLTTTPLAVGSGGTGNSTLTAHNVLLGEGTSSVAFAAPGSSGIALVSTGASSDPAFGSVSLTAGVTGTLPIANGGTNSNASLTNGYVIASFGGSIVTNPASNNLSMNNGQLNFVADPTSAQDAATKKYVDMSLNGLDWKQHTQAATAAVLSQYAYNNGTSGVGATITSTDGSFPTLVIDGYTPVLNDRILVKNETTGAFTVTSVPSGSSFTVSSTTGINVGTIVTDITHAQTTTVTAVDYGTSTVTVATIGTIANSDSMTYDNKPFNGIYFVSSTDNGNTTEWQLTRATDSNTPTYLEEGTAVFATNGTVNTDKGFIQIDPVTTVGTSDISYITFTSAVSAYFAGNGLDLSANTFSISTDDSLTANAANSTPSLVVKEDTTGGIYTHTGFGIALKLADASLQTTSSGVSVQEDAAGAISTSGSGIKVNTDGTTTHISSNDVAVITGNLTDVGTDGITITGGTGVLVGSSGASIAQHVADASHNGYLSSTDWSTFNGKLSTTLTSAHIFVGNGSNVATDTAVTGDVSITNAGVTSISSGLATHFVTRETPSGTINGSNTVFNVANTVVSGTEMVFLNGLLQNAGGNDYTFSGTTTITFTVAPESGSTLLVSYQK